MSTTSTPEAVRAGRTLRMMREAHAVSLRALADAAGISPGHLSRVEAGERVASDALTRRLCDIFATLPPSEST